MISFIWLSTTLTKRRPGNVVTSCILLIYIKLQLNFPSVFCPVEYQLGNHQRLSNAELNKLYSAVHEEREKIIFLVFFNFSRYIYTVVCVIYQNYHQFMPNNLDT